MQNPTKTGYNFNQHPPTNKDFIKLNKKSRNGQQLYRLTNNFYHNKPTEPENQPAYEKGKVYTEQEKGKIVKEKLHDEIILEEEIEQRNNNNNSTLTDKIKSIL